MIILFQIICYPIVNFGFRQFHSTASTLLDSTNEWFINMDRGKINIAVFLDLQIKSFWYDKSRYSTVRSR